MLEAIKQCAPWLNWKVVGVAGLIAAGLLLCTGLPSLSILAGVAPVVVVIACLVPCLIPLAFSYVAKGKANVRHRNICLSRLHK